MTITLKELLFLTESPEDLHSDNPEQQPEQPQGSDLLKGKDYVVVDAGSPESEELAKDVFELINSAYSEVGGHARIKSPNDLMYEYQKWVVADTDGDGKANAAICATKTRNGSYKVGIFATDSSPSAKAKVMGLAKEFLQQDGWWAEIPYQYAARLKSQGVNMVEDQTEVLMLLGGRAMSGFEWLGEYKKLPGAGYYKRNFFGVDNVRAILGNVHGTVSKIKDFLSSKKF